MSTLLEATCECNQRRLNDISLQKEITNVAVIPRIAHFIWLGKRPLPDYGKYCIKMFKKHHHDWILNIWTDAEVNQDEELRQLIEFAPNVGMKSDLLRYALLHRFGGVYADVDYEFLSNLEQIPGICSGHTRFFVGFSHCSQIEVNNGIMGSVEFALHSRRLICCFPNDILRIGVYQVIH